MRNRLLLWIAFGLVLAAGFAACGSPSSPSDGWRCDVGLAVPSTSGSQGPPSGTGTGATQEEALSTAYAQACEQLDLDSAAASLCRAGQDFTIEDGGSDDLSLHVISATEQCARQ